MHLRRLAPLACLISFVIACQASADARASKTDIARVYLEIDQAYMQADSLTPQARRTISRDFDRATAQFFSGDASTAVNSLIEILADLAPPESRSATLSTAGVLARFTPARLVAGADALTLDLDHATGALPDGPAIEMSIVGPTNEPLWSAMIDAPAAFDLSGLLPALRPARYELLAKAGTVTRPVAFFDVVSIDPRESAASFRERLNACKSPAPELRAAADLARSRLALLERPTDIQRLLNPAEPLRVAIDTEVSAIERGRNPYRDLTGHLWASITIGGREVPFRVYIPARRASPMPLVIALHGAGGDENLFPTAYGDAELTRLADESGFVIAAPSTYLLFGAPQVASDFIDAMTLFAPIDADRVYAIGHSLGGIAASSLARALPDKLTAACCLAGLAPLPPGPPMCPLLVYSAEFDIIVPDARIKPLADRLIAADEPVEYRLAKDEGHTLMVGPLLRPAIDWLLTHSRGKPEAPEDAPDH
ncbi:MAG: hypothetical protein KDA16_03255 [Phycisphaerales bacterium]|nr:hypothetical protein [Phycisphaerales bacterium]